MRRVKVLNYPEALRKDEKGSSYIEMVKADLNFQPSPFFIEAIVYKIRQIAGIVFH